jgi:hypothetical protein
MALLYLSNRNSNQAQTGQSLIELLLGIGMLAIIIPALLTIFVASRQGKPQSQERTKASAALEETQEAIRNIREAGWTNLTDGTFHPVISGSQWTLASGSEIMDAAANLTRQIVISDVYRDNTGKIVPEGSGATLDPSSKEVKITVKWDKPYPSSLESTSYLTRYLDSISLTDTTTTDFNKGTTSGTAVVSTLGSSLPNDGQVQLGAGGGSDWCTPNLSLASVDLPGQGITTDISAIEGHAYTTTGGNASGDSLDSVNITDTNPPAATLGPSYNNYKTYGVFADGSNIYLATDHPGATVDILDPSLGHKAYFSASGGGQATSIYTLNNVGYVTVGSSLYTFNLSTFQQYGSTTLVGTGKRVVVKGTHAYVATASTTNQLQIFDVSTPQSPTLIKNISLGNGQPGVSIFVNDTQTYAYIVTTYVSGKPDFYIIDLATDAIVGTYSTNGMNPKGVTVVPGNRAIIVGSGGEQYQVLNLQNVPANNPTRCGGLTLTGGPTSINAISTVIETDGDAYSYILTDDTSKEFQIIEGGPGGGLASSGDYTSQPFNLNYQVAFNHFDANILKPSNTTIEMQIAGAALPASNDCADAVYTFVGPNGDPNAYFIPSGNTISGTIPFGTYTGTTYQNPAQCFEYKVHFETSDETSMPILYDSTFNHSP